MYLFYLLLILVIFFPFTESFQFTHTGPAFNVSHAETDFVNVNHPLPMYVPSHVFKNSEIFICFFEEKNVFSIKELCSYIGILYIYFNS